MPELVELPELELPLELPLGLELVLPLELGPVLPLELSEQELADITTRAFDEKLIGDISFFRP